MNKFYLDENEDKDIAFAISCLFCQCLTIDEFKVWIEKVIRESDVDDIPPYIFELMDYNDALAGIFDVIGFDPEWSFDEQAENALYGIAYQRNMVVIEDFGITREASEKLLAKYPEVEKYFRYLFDFISW